MGERPDHRNKEHSELDLETACPSERVLEFVAPVATGGGTEASGECETIIIVSSLATEKSSTQRGERPLHIPH
jgi:hypothetical protein